MTVFHRLSLLAGVCAATLVASVGFQGVTQEAVTQPAREEATYEDAAGRDFAPAEVIVVLEQPASQADLRDLNRENDATVEEDLPRSDVNVVDLPRDLSVAEAVRAYEDSPDVAYAEPNFKVQPAVAPNDPNYRDLWGLNNTGQTGGTPDTDADVPEAWEVTTGSPNTVVGVIDEGIDVSHPDLRDNIWTNPEEAAGIAGVDDDKNGYTDDVNGYDFANNDASVYDPDPLTGNGDEHGTHVAGTIAATGNNGTGITGVNWDAQVAALKFLGPNGGYTSDAVEAINYAVREGMPISNNSWGGGGRSQALQDAITRADAAGHLVAAAGNGGSDGVGDDNDATPHFPSSYTNSNVVAVAASDDTDRLASFSNYGATSVDLAAPGVGILSTLPGSRYARYSGTSMATPHVAGVAALIESREPALDDTQIKAQLLQYVDDKASLRGKVATDGRLNAVKSMMETADAAGPTVTAPKPKPRSKTRDRTPRISATITDDRQELTGSGIELYLNGKKRGAAYDPGTNLLTYTAPRLSYAAHKVKVVASDGVGNTTIKTWSFKVVR